MALSVQDRDIVDHFREFIEDVVGGDERYGEPARVNAGGVMGSRFVVTDECWLEAVVRTGIPEVRVGFVTADPAVRDGITEMLADAGQTMAIFVGAGFEEAGLDWPNPTVDSAAAAGEFSFTTPFPIEELSDLQSDDVRDKVLRMLEGYLIAFGATILPDDESDFDEDMDDEEE